MKEKEGEPVMAASLEPGLAWMVIATELGGTERMQAGNLLWEGDGDWVDSVVDLPLILPFFLGAIDWVEQNFQFHSRVFPIVQFA